jgi:hypothetical protein
VCENVRVFECALVCVNMCVRMSVSVRGCSCVRLWTYVCEWECVTVCECVNVRVCECVWVCMSV